MTPSTKTYSITSEALANIRALASSSGLDLAADEGTIHKDGVTASYVVQGGELAVTLLSKPFFLSIDAFFSKLEATLKLSPES